MGTLLAPLPTQCPPASSLQNMDTFAFEDVGAPVPQTEPAEVQNKTSPVDQPPQAATSLTRPVATEKLTKYHLSPENIPVPPSFSADISSLVSPTSNNGSSCDAVNTSSNEAPSLTSAAEPTALNFASAAAAASLSSLSNPSHQSCQSFSCSGAASIVGASNLSALDVSSSNLTIAKNSHNQTAVPSTPLQLGLSAPISTAIPLLSLANVVGVSSTNEAAGTPAPKISVPVSCKTESGTAGNIRTENRSYEMGQLLQEMWDKKPSVKRMKYNCERCGEIFSYKLAFSKHTCHVNGSTTQ